MGPAAAPNKQESSTSNTELENRADKASLDLAAAKKALEATWIANGGTRGDFDRLINGAGYSTALKNISGRKLDSADIEKAERMAARISVFTEKLTSTAGDGFDPRALAGLEGAATKDWRLNSPHEIQLNHLQRLLANDNLRISALKNPEITKLTLSDSEIRPEKLPAYPEGYTTRPGPPAPTRPLKPVVLNELKNLIPDGGEYGQVPASMLEQREYFVRRSAEAADARLTGTVLPAPTLPGSVGTVARTPVVTPAPTLAVTAGAGRLESSAAPSYSAATKPEPRWTTGPIIDVLKRACLERPFIGEGDSERLARMINSAKIAISGHQPGDPAGRQESAGASFLLSGAGRERFNTVAAMRTDFFREYDALVKSYDGSNKGEEFKRDAGALIGRYSRTISDYISKEITSRVPSVVMTPDDVAEVLVSRRTLNDIGTMISSRFPTDRKDVASAPAAVPSSPNPTKTNGSGSPEAAPVVLPTPATTGAAPVKVDTLPQPVATTPPLVITPPSPPKPVEAAPLKPASVVPENAPDLRTAHAKGASYLVLYLRGGERVMHDLETGVTYNNDRQVIGKDLLRDEGIDIRKTKLNDGTYYVQVGCKLAGDISIEARRGGSPLQQSAVTCGVYEKGATADSWIQFPLDGAYGLYKISATARPEAKPAVVVNPPLAPEAAPQPEAVVKVDAAAPEKPAVFNPVSIAPAVPEPSPISVAETVNEAQVAEVARAAWLSSVSVDNRATKISFTLNGETVDIDPRDAESANKKLAKLGVRLRGGNIEFTKRGAFSINETYNNGSGSMTLNV